MSIFHDEIEIEDFEYDEEEEIYHYPCPCGDRFEISKVIFEVIFYYVFYAQNSNKNKFHVGRIRSWRRNCYMP